VRDVSKKEVCFWVVPPHDGKVRKYRCTVRRIAAACLLVTACAGAIMYVAGDYLRVQIQRAKIHFTVTKLASERDLLRNTNQSLEESVADLSVESQKARTYEQELRHRLAELSWILESAGALSPSRADGSGKEAIKAQLRRAPAKGAPQSLTDKASNGVGGAELECSGPNRSPRCGNVRPLVDEGNEGLFQPMSLVGNGELGEFDLDQGAIGRDSMEQLDYLIEIIKTLPIGMPANGHINSTFGHRISPFTSRLSMHEGIDYEMSNGSHVLATGDGFVKAVERTPTYGLVVDIAHTNRVISRYAHLSKTFVREGERVCRGETIGLVGTTGRSTGPHLHYEVRVDGVARDPQRFIELANRLQEFVGSSSHFLPSLSAVSAG
jgi:murein DD-endopeptidase MepM/ murein hydrolase activator NlpD